MELLPLKSAAIFGREDCVLIKHPFLKTSKVGSANDLGQLRNDGNLNYGHEKE